MTNNDKAPGTDAPAAPKNSSLDYSPLGDLVQANIAGQRLAADMLAELFGYFADPDTLDLALKTLAPDSHDIVALTRMRGFIRNLRKRIERSAP